MYYSKAQKILIFSHAYLRGWTWLFDDVVRIIDSIIINNNTEVGLSLPTSNGASTFTPNMRLVRRGCPSRRLHFPIRTIMCVHKLVGVGISSSSLSAVRTFLSDVIKLMRKFYVEYDRTNFNWCAWEVTNVFQNIIIIWFLDSLMLTIGNSSIEEEK